MNWFEAFNFFEWIWWTGLGLVCVVKTWGQPWNRRRWGWLAALGFIAFGVTELIEMRTGAWWKPPALMVTKGVSIAWLIGCGVGWVRALRRGSPTLEN